MSVGNDVVDLGDPESRLDALHPRWAERVFCDRERAALQASPPGERHRLHWALWAAKESAYKSRKRLAPEAVFSPREYVVELSPLPAAAGVAGGLVVHRGEAFAVEVRLDGDCLHAVATSSSGARPAVVSAVRASSSVEPGLAVRGLAAAGIGRVLRVDPGQVLVDSRPPVAWCRGARVGGTVSLSHHGRYVAFAFAFAAHRHAPPED